MRGHRFLGIFVALCALMLVGSCGKSPKGKTEATTAVAGSQSQSVVSDVKSKALSITPEALKAYEALQGIKYKIEVGTSYIEYGKMLSDASISVKSYLDSSDAQENKEFAELVEETWNFYVSALEVWHMKVEYGENFWPETEKIQRAIERAPMVATLTLGPDKRWQFLEIVQRLWSETEPRLIKLKTAVSAKN